MKNEPLLILVASKEEEELLIPSGLDNICKYYTIITGYGLGNTIQAIKEYAHECPVLNIGFVGVPSHMGLRDIYSINTSILGPNENSFNKPINLQTLKDLPQLPCITVTDFETNPDRFYPKTCYSKDYVIDMELYALANYFDTVYSIKIPSDKGDLKDYFSQSSHKKELNKIKNSIYNIIDDMYDQE